MTPVSLLVVGLVVLTVVAFGGSRNLPSTFGQPAGSAAAAAQAATTVTQEPKWLSGSGARLLNAVNADLGQVMAALRADHGGAAKADGGAIGCGCPGRR